MPKKLLLITAPCFAFFACNDYLFKDRQELIVVSRTPRGTFAGEEMPEEFQHFGWYEIGLSRNGKDPVEYIWRAGKDPNSYTILEAEIGDKGTVYLDEWEKKHHNMKLPRPNAENPPIIGTLGEVYWEKRE